MGPQCSKNKSMTDAIALYDTPDMICNSTVFINNIFMALHDHHIDLFDELLLTRVGTPDQYQNMGFTIYHMLAIWGALYYEDAMKHIINTIKKHRVTFGPITKKYTGSSKLLYIKKYKQNGVTHIAYEFDSQSKIQNDIVCEAEAIINIYEIHPLCLLHELIEGRFYRHLGGEGVAVLLHRFLKT